MTLQYDADWASHAKPFLEALASRPPPPVHDIEGRRAGSKLLFQALVGKLAITDDTTKEVHDIVSFDGATVKLYHYKPKNLGASPGPAVLHVHGGGMIGGEAAGTEPVARRICFETGLQYFDIEYRLAPEHPHPAPVEDTYAALAWISSHASELNIDPARIGIQGESAGGGIATGVSLMARDRKLHPPLAKMILTYPMLDYKNIKPVSPALSKFLIWSVESNITGWTALLGEEKMKSDDVSSYASPAHAKDLSGLPPVFMDLGGLDLFRDEDIRFAGRLLAADIPVELHVYPGVPHAFEAFGSASKIAQTAVANKMKALMSF